MCIKKLQTHRHFLQVKTVSNSFPANHVPGRRKEGAHRCQISVLFCILIAPAVRPVHPSHLSLSLCPTGVWTLEYKRELTTPLCITARNGHTACVRHLLFWRADPNMAPGGQSALHEACEGGHTDCTELLLEHRANPNLLSEEGLAPLHLCTNQNTLGCAKLLVKYGAMVDLPNEETQETPLHIAAKHGLCDHTLLYLRYGASVDRKNSRKETALSVTCGQAKEQEEQGSYLQVCRLLVMYGADVNTTDEEEKSPLHKACKNASHGLVQFLLQNKADVNAIDYNGASPLSCILQSAAFKQQWKPHLTVQTLLNHGSQKIWPMAFGKVQSHALARGKGSSQFKYWQGFSEAISKGLQ
uniref:Ankyrin repeat and SOCS box containing 18 n=1 Tax=Gopherus agassizii TaxID=38772 RepID=A0A452I981_9SAUR